MRTGIKKRSGFEEQSSDFVAFARSYLSSAFPNPDRQGCPPDEALQDLAVHPSRSESAITEHIASCSPCFNRYFELLAEIELERAAAESSVWKNISRWSKAHPLVVGAALACALFIALGISFLWMRFRVPNPPMETHQPPSPVQPSNPAVAYSAFTLDLTNVSPIRGSKPPKPGSQRPVPVPGAPLELTLSLPIGSEEQVYSLKLRDADRTLWSEPARAHLNHGRILIRIKADFTQVPAGNYNFELESKSGIKLIQAVSIQSTPPSGTGQKP